MTCYFSRSFFRYFAPSPFQITLESGENMARGIWKNSLLKIFLTRSGLGLFFRPFLYSTEERIHFDLIESLTYSTEPILQIIDWKTRALFYYWLIETPQTLFEELFLANESNQRVCSFIDDARHAQESQVAYLTQGYVLYYLEKLLELDRYFCRKFGLDVIAMRQLVCSVFGLEHPMIYYEKKFCNLEDAPQNLSQENIQAVYLDKMIQTFYDKKNHTNYHQKSHEIQLCQEFCSWKMANARHVTLAMLAELEQEEGLELSVLSRLK
jgi:hypothetical protein